MLKRCGWSLVLLLATGSTAVGASPSPEAAEFFEKQVRPLLIERCQKCHGDAKFKGGLQLISREAILRGGDTGPAAVAGKPGESLLVRAIHYDGDVKMPPKQKLPTNEVALLTRWVEMGLPWPETASATPIGSKVPFHITDEQRRFWCFQPVRPITPPVVNSATWPRTGLDRFILAELEAKGMKPAPQADRRILIRRATFDLTGLPPTPQEIDAFLKDNSPEAFSRVVDRLLSSPQYGERWGRHWLDVVRYTDSFDARGIGGEMDIADAWRYRDWVVRALNADLPYDQFIVRQIAGDLLPADEAGAINSDGIVATGMLAIGNWGGGDADKEKLLTDIADDQIDVVGRAFLGLTLACARCHDHKFDPIAQEDYYALAGIFFSTHILPDVGPKTNGPPMLRIPLLSPAELARRQQHQARIAESEKRVKSAREAHFRTLVQAQHNQTARYLLAAWDYQNEGAGEFKESVEQFAGRRGLAGYALRQWIDYLGGGQYRLMSKRVRDVLGHAGVHGWKGDPDCPSLIVNTTNQEAAILTFRLPPRSVSVHPGPANGVVVGWKSPISGTVRVTGRVADADPAGGDGIAWIVDQRTAGGRRELASGDIPNGGAQGLSQGKSAERLTSIAVRTGDRIELLVLPKANYICDTTVVELTITTRDGSAAWDLTGDLVNDPHQGNPHGDRRGHTDVWYFADMADSRRTPRTGDRSDAALAAWMRAAEIGSDRATVERAARDFEKAFILADARNPFWPIGPDADRYLPPAARAELAKLTIELESLRKQPLPPVPYANGAQDGGVPGSPQAGVHDVRIHIRGRYDRLAERVPRRFPRILAGDIQAPINRGSGRLQLARWIASPEHPLTARVMVNRIWQHHFGEGIVRTPSNFGKLGERPTHPELLDWLAREFVASGWSIKQMHRTIMLSAAYQQASEPDPATLKADPDNRLFGRMNRHRLEAEAIRDNLLAVAGRLDLTPGGPATREFNRPRRTLYLMTVRSDRSGFRPLFDVADPTAPVERRLVSTVAPQALFLLNHPFVLEQNRALARRILLSASGERDRINKAYPLLYGRPPSDEEVGIGLAFLTTEGGGEPAWQEYCQVLLCANEFIYVD